MGRAKDEARRHIAEALGAEADGTVRVDRATHVVFTVNDEQQPPVPLRRDRDGNYYADIMFNADPADEVTITLYQGEHRRVAGPILLRPFRCEPTDRAAFTAGRMHLDINP